MAKYNEILVGRFNNALKKIFSMKGPAPAPQLSSEIAATVSMFYGAEHRFLEQWDRYGAYTTVAGVAASFSTVQFRNPSGSNVVAIVEKLTAHYNAIDIVQGFIGAIAADLLTVSPLTNARFDSRGRPQPSLIRSTNANGAAFVQNSQWAAQAGVNGNIDVIATDIQEMPILPGDGLLIQSQTANTLLRCTVFWRERSLEESERQ